MFEISWGELFVLSAVSVSLVGRRDLPRASRYVGTQVGRIVGLLQGARARAERFTAQNELRQLQNELRAGLRELDAVKSEMAVAASGPVGIVGKSLGATVASVNRQPTTTSTAPTPPTISGSSQGGPIASSLKATNTNSIGDGLGNAQGASVASNEAIAVRELAPRSQAVAAVAEEEWQKHGIEFHSRAERGSGADGGVNGSTILANLLQQSLIHDQYDRVVQEQDQALQSKVDRIQEAAAKEKKK